MCDEPPPETALPPTQNTSDQPHGRPPAKPHDEPSESEPRRPERSAPPLSLTETRVHNLLLERLTEQQVADRLNRSPNTIHVHVRNIYRKLGVRSRKELYEIAKNGNPGKQNEV